MSNKLIYIGNYAGGINSGVIRAAEIYNTTLTSAQVSAIDGAVLQAAARADAIDIHSVVARRTAVYANHATTLNNHGFIDGISGNIPPLVDFENDAITIANGASFGVVSDLGVCYVPDNLYYPYTGAAVPINTTETAIASYSLHRVNEILGQVIYVAVALTDAGANLQLDFALTVGGVTARAGYKTCAADGTAKTFWLGPIYVPSRAAMPPRSLKQASVPATVSVYAKRTVAGAANVTMSFAHVMPHLMKLKRTGSAGAVAAFYYWSDQGATMGSSVTAPAEVLRITGERISFAPGRPNLIAYKNSTADGIAPTGSLSFAPYITPRWSL